MRRLQCEVCGSTDMNKQDEIIVCQSCGMKYSLEDVKEIMPETDVEESAPVEIEQKVNIQELMTLARRAKLSNDVNNALKYYSLIHKQEPTNWEAWFYCYYYQLFVYRNVPSQFANEIDDILKAMWSQVDEKDHENTISEIINNLNKTLTLCEKGEDAKSLDFEFVLFLLLSNAVVSINCKHSNYAKMLTQLSLNALKVAEVFTEVSEITDGYKKKEGIDLLLSNSNQQNKRWYDIEKMIISLVDILISNQVSPVGLGAVYYYSLGDLGALIDISNPPSYKFELTWLGSAIILQRIKGFLNSLNKSFSPWDNNMTEEDNINRIKDYNGNFLKLVNKAKRINPNFEYPNFYEQKEPEPSTNTSTNTSQEEVILQDTTDKIKYEFSMDHIGYLFYLIISYAIALFLGCVGGEAYKENDDFWTYLPFVIAIVCGLFFRYALFSEFGGHKTITFIAVSVAVLFAIIVTVILPEIVNAMGYWVLFVYAICL